MSHVIECPSCEKRFRLGDRPPATYACNQCGTVMDLSDFGGAAREPAAAAAAAPASRSQRRRGATAARGGGGAPARRSRGRGRPSAARARGAARRRDDYDDYEDDYRPRGRPRQSNAGMFLVLGTLGLVIVGLLIAVMSKKDDTPVDDSATRAANNTGIVNNTTGVVSGVRPGVPSASGATVGAGMPTDNSGGGGQANAGGSNAGTSGANPGGLNKPTKSKRRGRMGRHNVKRFKLQIFPWPDEVDEDTRAKVEEAITSMYRGDRQSRESQLYLISLGRSIGGRLINEFHTISTTDTFESREGRSKAQQIDTTLRAMDGWMERYWQEELKIQITTPPDTVLGLAKRWVVWWKQGYWKSQPREPWDDMTDRFEWEKKKDDPKKKKGRKKPGWQKRGN